MWEHGKERKKKLIVLSFEIICINYANILKDTNLENETMLALMPLCNGPIIFFYRLIRLSLDRVWALLIKKTALILVLKLGSEISSIRSNKCLYKRSGAAHF